MIVLGCNGFSRVSEFFSERLGATGINKHYLLGHDAAAALLIDGRLVAAVEEERLNREKKTTDFPRHAIDWCLREAGITLDDVDVFAFPWNWSPRILDEILDGIRTSPLPEAEQAELMGTMRDLFEQVVSHEAILADFEARTGHRPDPAKVRFVPHHLAHATTGYYLAGMKDSAFLVSDGRAERFSTLTGEIRDGRITVFDDTVTGSEFSMGTLFSAITRFLGFVPNNDEYKVMGLAGYTAPPTPNPFVDHLLTLHDDGRYTFAKPLQTDDVHSHDALFEEYFGPFEDTLEYKARVAAAAQQMLNVATAHQVSRLEKRTDLDRLLFEGGVALNCLNNTPLFEGSRFADLHVSFGASDTGITIGAAAHAWLNDPDPDTAPDPASLSTAAPVSPYLGPAYDDAAIEEALEGFTGRVHAVRLDDDELVEQVAKLLTRKVVIGWFEGRVEHGPRALGHRSILANPGFDDIKDIINTRVKHREPFRPFAPLVLEEQAPEIFDMGRKTSSPYMTFVFPVRDAYKDRIPGAVHVDGTSRIQTLTDEGTPRLTALLRRFTALTDTPCLINTSFNVAGEPIVCTPTDALKCFMGTEIDYLILGNHLVTKSERPDGR
ncbi:carbamoyltransferase C-terminal domain-containing protein [Streptomyces sp. LHD-70]|uniref:carbamoyltransferase family protein n=1 Tax=Streptomyces sp. LHD-70 TaxID=3072140 RepID=UPI0028107084|nr:carbamoyltransferase C-terminal domain-containing protein [Streptomyces sp. LHD-70]MDQ8703798.1 carbamoyltransferase C-terminal domain-containing protein [Streptomyces sp. LHD-70]